MKIQAKKQKAEPKKPIHYLKHGRVRYLYVIGISWIQIDTDPKTDWPEMPEYMRVCFAIEAPDESWATLKRPDSKIDYDLLIKGYEKKIQETEAFIVKAIKLQVSRQRKAYGTTLGRSKSLGSSADESGKPKKSLPDSKRSKRKLTTPMLPFESDDDSALRTGIA